jgi:hypothetical protein
MQTCDHGGFHSGEGRYDPAAERLRYVLVCDDCHSEVREIDSTEYRPRFEREVPEVSAA